VKEAVRTAAAGTSLELGLRLSVKAEGAELALLASVFCFGDEEKKELMPFITLLKMLPLLPPDAPAGRNASFSNESVLDDNRFNTDLRVGPFVQVCISFESMFTNCDRKFSRFAPVFAETAKNSFGWPSMMPPVDAIFCSSSVCCLANVSSESILLAIKATR